MRLGKKSLIVLATLLAVFALGTATASAENGDAVPATTIAPDASGAYVGNEPPPEVLNNSLTPSDPPVEVAGTAIERPAAEAASLAFTGGDTAAIAGIGAAALLAGIAMMAMRRRTATA